MTNEILNVGEETLSNEILNVGQETLTNEILPVAQDNKIWTWNVHRCVCNLTSHITLSFFF